MTVADCTRAARYPRAAVAMSCKAITNNRPCSRFRCSGTESCGLHGLFDHSDSSKLVSPLPAKDFLSQQEVNHTVTRGKRPQVPANAVKK